MDYSYVRFQRGLLANYQALEKKSDDTLYFVYDEDKGSTALYLGNRLIAGTGEIVGPSNLDELNDVLIKTVANKDILTYDSTQGQWVNMTFDKLIEEIQNDIDIAPSTEVYEIVLEVYTDEESGEKTKEAHNTAIARVVGSNAPNKGDIVIVKDPIAADKYQYTGYVYNGTSWAAMDGNYNADNVFFDEDFTFTKSVGTVTVSSGNKTVDAAGKSLKQFLAGLFAAEEESSITKPSISSFSINKAGSYEAGTQLTDITYSATFEDGKYTYGPEPTGVTVTAWTIKDNAGNDVGTEASGPLANYSVPGDSSYYLKATATYSDGNYAKTNLGNVSTTTRITASTTSNKDSNAITGYWQTFYKVVDSSVKNSVNETVNSSFIRGLVHDGAYAAKTLNLNAHEGAKCLVIACPANKTGITKAIMPSALNSPIPWIDGSPFTVSVEGATAAASTDYNVWIYEPASIDASETYEITIG